MLLITTLDARLIAAIAFVAIPLVAIIGCYDHSTGHHEDTSVHEVIFQAVIPVARRRAVAVLLATIDEFHVQRIRIRAIPLCRPFKGS